MGFQEDYAALSDEELLLIAASRKHLVDEAAIAMDSEMARRGLSYEEAKSKKREVARLEIEETRKRHPRHNSKYFVPRINGWILLTLCIGVLAFAIFLHSYFHVPQSWLFPILVTSYGGAIAPLAVQPWVRKTAVFWFSLAASCVVQFLVSRWIIVRDALGKGSESKGAMFLALVVGYALGAGIFLLLRKFKLEKEIEQETS